MQRPDCRERGSDGGAEEATRAAEEKAHRKLSDEHKEESKDNGGQKGELEKIEAQEQADGQLGMSLRPCGDAEV